MAIKDVDKKVAAGLAKAMAKSRGSAPEESTYIGSAMRPTTPKPVKRKKYKDTGEGITFSDCFGMAPPDGLPNLKASIYTRKNWAKEDQPFIPNKDDFKDYVPNVSVLYKLWVSVLRNNMKALVVGPTSSGKSSLQDYFAAHINQPLYRMNCHHNMESDTILGRPWVGEKGMEFLKGELVKSAEKGYWVVIDEAWKLPSTISMCLQRFYEKNGQFQLDDMPGEMKDKLITPDKRMRLVLCDNVVGTGDNIDQYAATMIQDGSTLNRIDVVIKQDYMSQDLEVKMLLKACPKLEKADATAMVSFVCLCRTSYEQRALSAALSPRNLFTWAELSLQLDSVPIAARWTFGDRFAEDNEQQLIFDHFKTVFDSTF